MKQELELLQNAPPSPIHPPSKNIEDPREKQRQEDENLWRLDIPVSGGPDDKGPLMDPTGKVRNYISMDSVKLVIDETTAPKAIYNPSFECR